MPRSSVILARPEGVETFPIPLPVSISVREVATGDELLRALDLDPSTAAVLLDERLVFKTPGDLLAKIRGHRGPRAVPIVLIASRRRAGDVLARARGAAEAVLFEPVDPDELARTLRHVGHATPEAAPADAEDADLVEIWAEHREDVLARIELVEAASRAALEGRLGPDLRARATVAAHQLAGSMGVFGFKAAGEHAKHIDGLLRAPSLGRIEVRRMVEASIALRDAVETRPDTGVTRPPGLALVLIEPDPRDRARIEAEARESDLVVVSHAGVPAGEMRADGFVVALAADPSLIFSRRVINGGAPLVVRGFGHDRVERAAVAKLGRATYVSASADAAEVVSTWVELVARSRRFKGARILLVDDDPLVHVAVRAALVPLGVRLRSVTDPHSTWAALEREPVDLILLDVEMPGVSGIELCRSLRADARWSGSIVVFFTSLIDPETIRRIWAAGADDYVPKPLGPQLISRISARLASSRSAIAEPPRPPADLAVVLVEDDAALARLLLDVLERQDLLAVHLSDGAVALAQLGGTDPSLRARVILLDVGLPGADGYAVLRQLRSDGITRTSRVIMLTARASEPEVVQALEGGAFDHVAKPFSLAVLMHRVRRALDTPL